MSLAAGSVEEILDLAPLEDILAARLDAPRSSPGDRAVAVRGGAERPEGRRQPGLSDVDKALLRASSETPPDDARSLVTASFFL